MYAPLESMFETSGFDEQARSRFSMDVFFEREGCGSALWHLYRHWKALPKKQHGLPAASMCNPKPALPRDVAKWIAWIDTTKDDPTQFIIWEHPESHIPGMGVELSGKLLNDIPVAQLHISACAIEYLYCKHERIPMYHEIDQILCGYRRQYTRLLVPLADENGNVSRIFYAIRMLSELGRVNRLAGGVI
ncbi:MAG: hypothetical protein WD767_02315 [Alphaproteobacteria bacterium]